MKKSILTLSIAVAALALTSCKKERDCKCTTTVNGVTTESVTKIDDTKKKAEESCDDKESSGVTCEIVE